MTGTLTRQEEVNPKYADALSRALQDKSHANYMRIINEFGARGVPHDQVIPRVNVFTYNAWKAQGRQVRKGEHGVKIEVMIEKELRDRKEGTKEKKKFLKRTTVFHVSQTDLIGEETDRPPLPMAYDGAPLPERPKPGPDLRVAEKFREAADNLELKIDELERPMTQRYTPKRNMYHRDKQHEAQCLRQTRLALRALAEAIDTGRLPAELHRYRTVKDVASAMRLQSESVPNGYYAYRVTKHGCYIDDSPEAQSLQRLVAGEAAQAMQTIARMAEIIQIETELRGQRIPGFFPTPPNTVAKLLREAEIGPGMEVLEPSAGIGSIAEAVRVEHPDATILCVEKHPTMARLLELKCLDVLCGDFLEVQGQVDRVLMNPPYEQRQDATHVRHAYSLLRPGGRLVAIVSAGLMTSDDSVSIEFREWFFNLPHAEAYRLADNWCNGADAFRTTAVSASILVASA